MQKKVKLGVIGGGFMANAIVKGAIETNYLKAEEILVSEPEEPRRSQFLAMGCNVCHDNVFVASRCEYLLLAIKPQVFPEIASELQSVELPVVISIMGGRTKSGICKASGAKKVARIMPNLPCSVGSGMAGVDISSLSEQEKEFVCGLFSSVGEVAIVEEELLNAVTGISGSGPAYVYLFYRSLVQAGMAQGMSEELAEKLSLQTIAGGVEMLKTSNKTPDELIAAVSSKGGTTIAALNSFEKDDFSGSVMRAVDAAVRRAEELSE